MKRTPSLLALTLIALTLIAMTTTVQAGVTKIQSIDFKTQGNQSLIEISGDGSLEFEKTENQADSQVIINIKNAKLGPSASRKLDTSSFDSPVQLVSPYQIGNSNVARIVIQLRNPSDAQIVQNGNSLTVAIAHAGGSAKSEGNAKTDTPTKPESAEVESPPMAMATTEPHSKSPREKQDESTQLDSPGASKSSERPLTSTEKRIDDFIDTSKTKNFIGKPITLQLRDADILDVLQMIGDASGFNVIVGDDVKGKVTLSLVDAPWDQALDLILSTRQLGAERNNNVLRITTLANLTAEKKAELEAKKASEASAPKVTRIFPISYAKLGDLQTVFQKFASGTGESGQTIIQTDERTNSIIVRDTADNIERIKKLIAILDTQTPQVLIEAKIVEVSESANNGITGSLGLNRAGDTQLSGSFNGGILTQDQPTLGGAITNQSLLSSGSGVGIKNLGGTSSDKGGLMSFSPSLSFLPGFNRLNALLSMSEGDSKLKIIASPRTVVLNKESANITQGTPVKISTIQTSAQGSFTAQAVVSANLSLAVTPTVTNEGSVLLNLNVSRDLPSADGVSTRNMTTKVLVDSGSTLVIGGIYTADTTDASSGFPVLRDIPIIGNLFGSKTHAESRSELFIFISPRILNEKESGLAI